MSKRNLNVNSRRAHIQALTRAVALYLLIASSSGFMCPAWAGTASHELTHSGQEVVTGNPSFEQSPAVTITGITDDKATPVRHTLRPALNGVTLAEKMLTLERLTLRFGSGRGYSRYNAGFSQVGDLTRVNDTYAVQKWQWDIFATNLPFTKDNFVYDAVGARRLKLGWPGVRQTTYRLSCPAGVRILAVEVEAQLTDVEGEDEVYVKIARDPEGKDIVATKTFLPDSPPWRFEGLNDNPLHVVLSSNGKSTMLTYELVLHTWLDISALKPLQLAKGMNRWTYTDDDASSHRARLKVEWVDTGEKLENFEDALQGWSASAGASIARDAETCRGANSGKACAKVVFHREKENRHLSIVRGFDKPQDWTRFNTIRIAVNCPQAHQSQSVFAFFNRDKDGKMRTQVISATLRETDEWETLTFDISGKERGDVTSWGVYSGGFWATGEKLKFFIDDVYLSEESVPKGEPLDDITRAALLGSMVCGNPSPVSLPPSKRAIPDPRSYFPIGPCIGGNFTGLPEQLGVDRWRVVEAQLDDCRSHHQNAAFCWGVFGSQEDRLRFFRLAERKGIRVYYQGPNYLPVLQTRKLRTEWYEKNIRDAVPKISPAYRGEWGLLGWEIAEEIPPEMVEEVVPYHRQLMELDPLHPPIVCHNNLQSFERAAEQMRPPVIAYDVYPILAGWTRERIRNYYLSILDRCYRAARKVDARLWIIAQSYAEGTPQEDFVAFTRSHSTPAQMKWQAWTAVAHGVTGLFLYYYGVDDRKLQEQGLGSSLISFKGEGTPQWKAWAEVSKDLLELAPLLTRLERVEEPFATTDNENVELNFFIDRKSKDRYIIAVNKWWEKGEVFRCQRGEGWRGRIPGRKRGSRFRVPCLWAQAEEESPHLGSRPASDRQ